MIMSELVQLSLRKFVCIQKGSLRGCRGADSADLDVIGLTVKVEPMAMDNPTEGEEEEDEGETAKYRALRYALEQGGNRG